jgi:hypothetical protein
MTRADSIVILLTLMLLPFLYINYWGNGNRGEQLVIHAAGEKTRIYPLHKNQHIEVNGVMGTNIIEIENGKARFINAPCQNKQCILTGRLDKDGDIAACLPNGVSIQIQGRDKRFDAVNF